MYDPEQSSNSFTVLIMAGTGFTVACTVNGCEGQAPKVAVTTYSMMPGVSSSSVNTWEMGLPLPLAYPLTLPEIKDAFHEKADWPMFELSWKKVVSPEQIVAVKGFTVRTGIGTTGTL